MSTPSWDYIAKLVCIGDSGTGKSSLTIRLCEGRFSPQHDVTIGVEFGSRIVKVGPPNTPLPSLLTAAATTTTTTTTKKKTTANPTGHPPTTSRAGAGVGIGPGVADEDEELEQDEREQDGDRKHTATTAPAGLPSPRLRPTAAEQQSKSSSGKAAAAAAAVQKHMKLSLWDTAGQETYKSVTRSYFRGASGALLVFDISRRPTFAHATDWLNDLRVMAESDIVVVLVGNKSDLAADADTGTAADTAADTDTATDPAGPDGDGVAGGTGARNDHNKREVSRAEAEQWARANGVLEYVETSAKSGEGVEMAFGRVAERIYQNIEAGRYDLNDRRSGVKGPGAGGGGGGAAAAGGKKSDGGTIRLGGRGAAGDAARKSGWGTGGCC